jgi:flagellar protein FlaI
MVETESRVVSEDSKYVYRIKLPILSPDEMKLIESVKEVAIKEIKVELGGLSQEQKKQNFLFEVLRIMDRNKDLSGLKPEKKEQLAVLIVDEVFGYSLLEPFLEDDEIEEIMVIGPKRPVYVYHRNYGMLESNVVFQDPGEINTLAQKIAKSIGRKIDVSSPLLDARLTDGSRINATLSPPSLDGSTITVRKFKKDPFTIVDLIRVNTLPSEVAAFLWLMADGYGTWKKNILIAGGTGCGKTTTLNALTIFIRERERVITIEDTAELQLPIQHLIRFETRSPDVEGKGEVDMDALVKNTLRMRPDRIIVGEVRSGEARSLFTAMNTGHDGSMGTVHANSSRETISRLTNPPMDVPLMMLSSLDLILMEARISLGDKGLIRRITEVTEIGGLSEDTLALSKIYEWDPAKDELQSTGTPSKLKQDLAKELGIPAKEVNNELEKRRLVLDYLLKQNIREFSEVRSWIESYYTDSDKTLSKIEESFRT